MQPTVNHPGQPQQPQPNNLVIFSGGSAANSLVDVFEHVRTSHHSSTRLSYIIPISDNGGSSSEIIRVFGGPGIGDVRSRLVRLIPDDDNPETAAVKCLFNHRLPRVAKDARAEWFDILEATHSLWDGISSPKRELVRSYLNSFNVEVVKRMRPSSRFDFSGASIGNLFLTGARLFTGSFEAAVFLLSSVCSLPDRVAVLPSVNTNFALHIAAGLQDGTVITGQNNISHPSAPTAAVPAGIDMHTEEHDKVEDANLPGSLPALRKPAIVFSKDQEEDLPSRIDRVWYINPYGQEIKMAANPRVIDALKGCHTVIYSIGSLYTSLIPSLVLRDVGETISTVRSKILILNGTTDRETGPLNAPFTGLDFVAAIATACADSRSLPEPTETEYVSYVTHVIYIEGPNAPKVDRPRMARLGIECLRVYGPGVGGRYDPKGLMQALESIVGRGDVKGDRSRRNTLVG